MHTPLSIHDAIAKSASQDIIVIDLREPAEIAATGAARGALRLPLSLLPIKAAQDCPDRPAELGSGKPIALYCAAGARAERGKDILHALGYDSVHNIGGFGHWAQAGGPVDR